jgi:hypothetical protein
MTTTRDVLDAIRTHLDAFELPPPWSIYLTSYSGGPAASVNLAVDEPSQIAEALLAWADTLTDVSAQSWRPLHGDIVDLSITGQLSDGVVVGISGHLPFTRRGIGGDLTPGARKAVSLVLLRQWADPGEASV